MIRGVAFGGRDLFKKVTTVPVHFLWSTGIQSIVFSNYYAPVNMLQSMSAGRAKS